MNTLFNTLHAEILKLRRAWFFRIMLILFVFLPFMMSMILFVAMNPEAAGEFGFASSKAGLAQMGEPGWDSYFKVLLQTIAGVGIVGTGFVASWLFGREFALETAKDMLALPVSRSTIVIAKFVVIIFWSLLLALTFYAAGLLFGWLIGLGAIPEVLFHDYTRTYAMSVLLMIHLSSVAALLASYSRGYMLPIGFIILMVIFTNFTSMIGIAPYFPWTVPGLFAVSPGELTEASYVVLGLTCVSGYVGTVWWWKWADQK